ncbi:MAG: hypothetical protein AUJ79_06920 [Propionibacterium sp. CG1_02_60_36]|nr:MAG: hypothetical protein AUJ79_06920 [Propionibacterium sp. CG1_02_60_36]
MCFDKDNTPSPLPSVPSLVKNDIADLVASGEVEMRTVDLGLASWAPWEKASLAQCDVLVLEEPHSLRPSAESAKANAIQYFMNLGSKGLLLMPKVDEPDLSANLVNNVLKPKCMQDCILSPPKLEITSEFGWPITIDITLESEKRTTIAGKTYLWPWLNVSAFAISGKTPEEKVTKLYDPALVHANLKVGNYENLDGGYLAWYNPTYTKGGCVWTYHLTLPHYTHDCDLPTLANLYALQYNYDSGGGTDSRVLITNRGFAYDNPANPDNNPMNKQFIVNAIRWLARGSAAQGDMGTLELSTDPAGAMVTFDGDPALYTSDEVTGKLNLPMQVGTYSMHVSKDGYVTGDFPLVVIQTNSETRQSVTLIPESVTVTIQVT